MSDSYLRADDTDALARMVLALLSEVWIVRDRAAIMEKLLIDHGVLAEGAVEEFVPSAEFALELEKLRNRLVGNVVGAPLASEDRSVDAILSRAGMKRPSAG